MSAEVGSQEWLRLRAEFVYLPRLLRVLDAGQAEYAGGAPAFGNFERLSQELDTSREKVLWTYAIKHKDGIAAWIRGHKSQREDVRGRIQDLMVYLLLLWGMCDEEELGPEIELDFDLEGGDHSLDDLEPWRAALESVASLPGGIFSFGAVADEGDDDDDEMGEVPLYVDDAGASVPDGFDRMTVEEREAAAERERYPWMADPSTAAPMSMLDMPKCGDPDAWDVASDLAYDAAREQGRRGL